MKKMPLATALALLITGSTDVYCSKQTGSSSTRETITHHFFVSGIGQKRKLSMQQKICGGAENVKTETQQTFVNGCSVLLL